jgi:hypothetical protein
MYGTPSVTTTMSYPEIRNAWNGFIEDVQKFCRTKWELYLDYKLWHIPIVELN